MSSDSSLLESAYNIIKVSVTYNEFYTKFSSTQVKNILEYAYETYRETISLGHSTKDKQLINLLCVYVARQAVKSYLHTGQKLVEELLKIDDLEKAVDLLRYVSWLFDILSNISKEDKNKEKINKEKISNLIKSDSFEEFLKALSNPQISK